MIDIMYNVGIIGYGVVGKAIDYTFSKKNEVIKYDKYNRHHSFSDLASTDFVFISVPTPFIRSDGSMDVSAVEESLVRLESINYRGIVIIKSTLPPGSTEKLSSRRELKILFNPEFLRQSTTPNEDFANQKLVVIGASSKTDFESVEKLYKSVLSDDAQYFMTTYTEAEMVKISQNTMLGSRVLLANMIFKACEKANLDYNLIKKLAFDECDLLGPEMVSVPGPDGKLGFGGKCLPKDMFAFSSIFKSSLISSLLDYNETLRDDLDDFLE